MIALISQNQSLIQLLNKISAPFDENVINESDILPCALNRPYQRNRKDLPTKRLDA
jgi:hypothetical protein